MFNTDQLQKHLFDTSIEGSQFLTTRIANDAYGNAQYIGKAAPGAAESAPAWMIQKIIYDVGKNPSSIIFANSKANFDQVWEDRESLSYG
ncbi:MAG: hypothetical protein H7832_14805 [Magnetococcus sp. DMHC-6]